MRFVGIDRAMWSLVFTATQHIAHACGEATECNSAGGKSFRKRVKKFPAPAFIQVGIAVAVTGLGSADRTWPVFCTIRTALARPV